MRRLAIVGGVLAAVWATPAHTLLVDLTPEQIEQAIAYGRETYEKYRQARYPIDDLDAEYIVDRGPEGRALLFTEFGSIALETRRYLAIGRRFTPADLTPILAPLRGRIEFIVVAYGSTRDFLRESRVALIDRKGRQEPKSWHINRGLPRPEAPGGFLASGRYMFEARDIDTATPAVLVVQTPEGREFRFEFDLARLR